MEKKLPSRIRRKRNIKIKKSTIGMFVTVFAFVFALFRVFAGENPKVTISHVDDAKPGDTVTLNVDLTTNQPYNGIALGIEYDPDKLELVTAVANDKWRPYSEEEQAIIDSLDKSNIMQFINQLNQLETSWGIKYSMPIVNTDTLGHVDILLGFTEDGRSANADNNLAQLTFKVKDDATGKLDVSVYNFGIGLGEEEYPVDWEDGYIQVNVPVEDVSLEKNAYELNVGDTEEIKVLYSPLNTTDIMDPNYVSDNEAVVTVSPSGVITAQGRGHATITVTAFGKEMSAEVDVVQHITGITITGAKHNIVKDEQLQLSAAVTPQDNDDDGEIYWSSSNPAVASVDEETGLVTGKTGGQTLITAGTRYNDETEAFEVVETYEVNVVVPITSFTATISELPMNWKDAPYQIDYTVYPSDNTENKTITWTTDNENVATVSPDGVIAPVGGGTATITGSLGETINNIPDIEIEVTVVVPLEDITLDQEGTIDLIPGQTQELKTTVNPSETTDTSPIVWTSSNPEVATVDGGVVTAVAPGTTTITVTKGSKSDTVEVHVLVPIEGIAISEPSVTLNRNETKKLEAIVTPIGAEQNKTVKWTSSDPTSVSVDQQGNIKGEKGTQTPVTITASVLNGKYSATATVTVVVKIIDIYLDTDTDENVTELTINKGENETLTVRIDPEDTSENTDVTWKSTNPEVATVDANGKVHAEAPGTTVVSATVGTHTKNCSVTVLSPITSVEINSEDFTLNRGGNKALTATVKPSDTTDNKTVTWTSSNTTVAEVDQSGNVIAKAAGEATITAKAGNKSDTVKVTVIVPITKFTVDKETVTIVKGKTEKLTTTIEPTETTESQTITWTTGNANVATVENGTITAVGEGTTTITGTLPNNMKVTTTVTVTIIPVESISVSGNDTEILRKKTTKLSVSYAPEDATEVTDVVWTSSDEGVATVDQTGLVTGVAEGTVTITAKMGQLTDTYELKVKEVPLEGISLDDNPKEAEVGKNFQLQPKTEPFNATDDIDYTYESSDPEIATVDPDGTVRPKKAGKVTITIKASNGVDEFEDTIELTIKVPSSPKTGVTPIWVYGGVFVILLAIGLVIYKKKELF